MITAKELHVPVPPEAMVDLGDRVILAAATDRRSDALGTVIARDPYPDRGIVVGVLHEDGVLRWHRRDSLRGLGYRMSAADLVADLKAMDREDLALLVTAGGA